MLVTVCVVAIVLGVVRGLAFLSLGHVLAALAALAAGAIGLLVLLGLRAGFSVRKGALIQFAAVFVVLLVVAITRGGVGTSILLVYGVLTLVVTFVLGIRAGLICLGAALLTVGSLALVEAVGLVVLEDRLDPPSAQMMDTVVAVVVPIVLYVLGLVYERTRLGALEALESARDERAAAEEDIRLLRKDKMASMGQLAAGVGHEINNPLTYIQGNLDFMLEALDSEQLDRAELIRALTDARDGAVRIARITRDLSQFSRVEDERERRAVALDEVVAAALALTRREVVQRARLRTELGAPGPVFAIHGRLVQVVVNLLINAAHALEGQEDGEIVVRTGERNGSTWLEVEDNGPGIPLRIQRRVFDAFFTTKAVRGGSGLGLSVSEAIVRSSGGALEVQSNGLSGTTFRMSLPLYSVDVPPMEYVPLVEVIHQVRILVVDDEPLVGRALLRLLAPYDVVWCETGAEALRVLGNEPAFDLVLCDLMMSPMDGEQVMAQVQIHHPEMMSRFAFMTGGAFTSGTKDVVNRREVPVLFKPLQLSDVSALLESMQQQTVVRECGPV